MVTETQQQKRSTREPTLQLSSDELTGVLQEASRRQGQAIGNEALSLTRVEDVFAVAEELGIPEEHVRTALASHQRKEQPKKRALVRSLLVAGVGGGLAALGLGVLGAHSVLVILGGGAIATAIFIVGFLAAAMKSYPARPSGPLPVPGTCRVCFRPAHTPHSTFCDEHRYRKPPK